MTLDLLPLRIAGRLVTRRWRRNTERGIRHDEEILRWARQLRAMPTATELTGRRKARVKTGGAS